VSVDGSPWFSVLEFLQVLKQKGHEIVVVAPEANLNVKPSENFVMKIYPVALRQEGMHASFEKFLKDSFAEGSFLERFIRVHENVQKVTETAFKDCEQLLYNKELIRYLEDSNF
ncbi:UD11 glucuronosyltransferase, partial [Odontophorus gujanensis]|nr:UD11 glucuronosyltransferase [Odontophorus gujanensis]